MAEARQELDWDLSNNVMAASVNNARAITDQMVALKGKRPKIVKPLNFYDLNPFRKDR